MTRRPGLKLAGAGVALVLATGIGWWGSTLVRSPAQVLADSAAPPTTPLTVKVRRAPLRAAVVANGKVSLGGTSRIDLPTSGVLTSIDVVPGQRVASGDRLVTINDRPVIALPGQVPLWRDLRQGDSGPDVERLQQALRLAGHPIDDPTGMYGASTAAAIDRLYAGAGAKPTMVRASARPSRHTSGGRRQQLARSEIVMVTTLPSRVWEVEARLGSEESERSLTFAARPPGVTAVVVANDAQRIKLGDRAQFAIEGEETEARGRVVAVEPPRMDAEEGYVASIRIQPVRSLDLADRGKPVRLTIKGTGSHSELLVPLTTVWQETDGGTYVVVVDAGGARRQVQVLIRGQEGGLAAVRAAPGERLAEGDGLLIGTP